MQALTKAIINHIFLNIKNDIKHRDFLLKEKLTFTVSDNTTVTNNIWGCELDTNKTSADKIKIIFADCSVDTAEYALIVKMDDAPPYGMFYSEYSDELNVICYQFGSISWSICTMYLQALFLAGVEKLKDVNIPWVCLEESIKEVALIKDFIEFHETNIAKND